MKKILLTLLLLTSVVSVMAYPYKGFVSDGHGQVIAGANCVCFSLPDSTLYSVAMSDESGILTFDAPAGRDWYIVVSSLGYHPRTLSNKEFIKLSEAGRLLGQHYSQLTVNIPLAPKASELREVVVTARKGDISMKNGIISYNNLDEIRKTRAISSAHDLLLALPLLYSTDGENISLTGAPLGSVIYINGKRTLMDTAALIDYLKSIPPEMIKGVEIIYTPSPKWKTRSSVINVTIKRNDPHTLNGQVSASGTWQHLLSGRLGSSVFCGLPKWNVNAGYSFNCGKTIQKEVYSGRHTVGNDVFDVSNTEEARSLSDTHHFYVMADYEIDKSNSLSINYDGQFFPKVDSDSYSDNSAFGIYKSGSRSKKYFNAVSLSYSNKKGIDAGIDYWHYTADRNQIITGDDTSGNPALTGHSDQTANRTKAYLDMTTPLGRQWNLSYGASYEFSRNANRLINISDDPDMVSDDVRTKTDEHIANAYLGVQKSFFEGKLNFSANLKGEYYKIADYKKTQLLPTATVTFMPSQTHIFQASYQSFKSYPSLWQRQDYKSYVNPYQLNEGNPTLKPATYNIASLMYFFKQKYTLGLTYYRVNNFFYTQSYQSNDALVLISQPYNFDFSQLYQLTLSIPVSIGKIFYSNITTILSVESYKSSDWHNLSFNRSKFGGYFWLNNTLTISQKPKISINVTGMYRMPSIIGLWNVEHGWLLNAGVTGTFLNDNLTISLKGSDLLRTLYGKQQMRFDRQWMDVDNNYYTRGLSLSVSYKFKGYQDKNIKSRDTSRYGFD